MHITNLRKVGRSVMLTVPPAILDLLHLRSGATVGIVVMEGHLLIEPQSRPRYSLEELLAQCDASAEMAHEDQAWFHAQPCGKELL